MKSEKPKFLIAGLVIAGVVIFLLYFQRTPALSLTPERKEIYLISGTLLRTTRRELKSFNDKWYVIEPTYGLPVGIATPYSMRFNDYYEAILEPHGTLAMVSNDHLERSELKWIDGEWRHKDPSTTEWLEFGEPDPPEHEDQY